MGFPVNYTFGTADGRVWMELQDLLLVPTPQGTRVRTVRIITRAGAGSPYLCGANGIGTRYAQGSRAQDHAAKLGRRASESLDLVL